MKGDSAVRDIQALPDTGHLYAAHVINDIWRLTEGKAVVVTDVGQHQMWEAQYYHHNSPRSLITSGGLGTMGFAVPAAIGAKMARPEAEVWAIVRPAEAAEPIKWKELKKPFNKRETSVDPKTGEAPTPQEAIAQGYALVGTVDTVTRSLEALKKKLPVDWIFGWTHNMLVPHATMLRSIEEFQTKVLPRLA